MRKIDYKNLKEITVKTQDKLDAIPDDFTGKIYIESDEKIFINKRYTLPVLVMGKSYVITQNDALIEAHNSSSVIAKNRSKVKARDNSSVIAKDCSDVIATDNSIVEAHDNSFVSAYDDSSVVAYNYSNVIAAENSNIIARESSSVQGCDFSTVTAKDNSNVIARGLSTIYAKDYSNVIALNRSKVIARGNSSIVACDSSTIESYTNVQVTDKQGSSGVINANENSRIVSLPKSIDDFMSFHDIRHTETDAIFYKAVHKTDKENVFVSDHDPNFKYIVGDTAREQCDTDTNLVCAKGIHISPLDLALYYGANWDDLAIIECETTIPDIVIPKNTDGKVRTSEIKVLREVPLEECGTYGKILANSKR